MGVGGREGGEYGSGVEGQVVPIALAVMKQIQMKLLATLVKQCLSSILACWPYKYTSG